MAARDYLEGIEQRALVSLINMHATKYPVLADGIFHVPNEGLRSKNQHGRLIAEGMRPGVSDLVLPRARRGYLGVAMEMKAPGKITATTDTQRTFLRAQQREGWLCVACDSAALGWTLLRWYAQGERHHGEPEPIPANVAAGLLFTFPIRVPKKR